MASIGLQRPGYFFMIKEYFKNSKVTASEQEGAHLAVLSQESVNCKDFLLFRNLSI